MDSAFIKKIVTWKNEIDDILSELMLERLSDRDIIELLQRVRNNMETDLYYELSGDDEKGSEGD